MSLKNKFAILKKNIAGMKSVLVAFSGGVDSTFLLKVAADELRKNCLAVTAKSETYPAEELTNSKRIAKNFKVRHLIIRTKELKNPKFSSNPVNRCYFCKRELFGRLKQIAKKNKLNFVIDASNASDVLDFRPGEKAKNELGVRSPLQEAGLTKEDIRILSKKLKLATWDKPAQACLASRIPYGTKISSRLLKQVNQGEFFLRREGFNQVRVRHHDFGLCRIELLKEEFPLFFKISNKIVEKFKGLGYNYVTLDLAGYRTGSLNEVIKK